MTRAAATTCGSATSEAEPADRERRPTSPRRSPWRSTATSAMGTRASAAVTGSPESSIRPQAMPPHSVPRRPPRASPQRTSGSQAATAIRL